MVSEPAGLRRQVPPAAADLLLVGGGGGEFDYFTLLPTKPLRSRSKTGGRRSSLEKGKESPAVSPSLDIHREGIWSSFDRQTVEHGLLVLIHILWVWYTLGRLYALWESQLRT
jgi:hypothetical protein